MLEMSSAVIDSVVFAFFRDERRLSAVDCLLSAWGMGEGSGDETTIGEDGLQIQKSRWDMHFRQYTDVLQSQMMHIRVSLNWRSCRWSPQVVVDRDTAPQR